MMKELRFGHVVVFIPEYPEDPTDQDMLIDELSTAILDSLESVRGVIRYGIWDLGYLGCEVRIEDVMTVSVEDVE